MVLPDSRRDIQSLRFHWQPAASGLQPKWETTRFQILEATKGQSVIWMFLFDDGERCNMKMGQNLE